MSSPHSYNVQFAVFNIDHVVEPLEMNAETITLDPVDISLNHFRDLFYSENGNTFSLNRVLKHDEFNLTTKTLNGYPFSLSASVLNTYVQLMGIPSQCLDPCSSIKITNQLSKIKFLTDICHSPCSLTFDDVIMEIIRNYPASEHVQLNKDDTSHNFELLLQIKNEGCIKDIFIKLIYHVVFVKDSSSVLYTQTLADQFNEQNTLSIV